MNPRDVVVLGAGPVGIFSLFELGLYGIENVLILDALPKAGGQCSEFYPQKPIYDIPAYPCITGAELIKRLLEQALPFDPTFSFDHPVQNIEKDKDSFVLMTEGCAPLRTKTLVLATGAGRFTPNLPRLPGIQELLGSYIFTTPKHTEAWKDKDVIVAGGGDSALDWTFYLSKYVRSLTLLHRREDFTAVPNSIARLQKMRETGHVSVVTASIQSLKVSDGRLHLNLGDGKCLSCQRLLVSYGFSVRRIGCADQLVQKKAGRVEVNTISFSTKTPGFFAIGDGCTYPGKQKLILSGFHEAALMAHALNAYLHPNQTKPLGYTTTNSRLLERLQK